MTTTRWGRRLIQTAALTAVAAVTVAACGRSSTPSSSAALIAGGSSAGPIVVAATFPQSGPLAVAGAAGRGVKAAIEQADQNGGIDGRQITWVGYDDAYDPARMAANARRAVEQDKATVLVSFGGPSLAIRPYLNAHKVFQLVLAGNTPLSDTTGFPYSHAWYPDLGWEAAIQAQALKQTKPDATVGVLGLNNDLTDSQAAGVRKGGYTPALVLKVPPSQQDLTAQITQLKSAGVDTLFLSVGVGQIIGAVKYMAAIHYAPTIVLYSATAGKNDAITALGPLATGIYTALWIADPADPLWAAQSDVSQFKAAMKDSGVASDPDNILAMGGYAAGVALVHALKEAKGGNADALNAAWKATKGLVVPGLPPGTSLQYGPGGRLVYSYQVVRWDGTGWQPQGSLVNAISSGIAK